MKSDTCFHSAHSLVSSGTLPPDDSDSISFDKYSTAIDSDTDMSFIVVAEMQDCNL